MYNTTSIVLMLLHVIEQRAFNAELHITLITWELAWTFFSQQVIFQLLGAMAVLLTVWAQQHETPRNSCFKLEHMGSD